MIVVSYYDIQISFGQYDDFIKFIEHIEEKNEIEVPPISCFECENENGEFYDRF